MHVLCICHRNLVDTFIKMVVITSDNTNKVKEMAEVKRFILTEKFKMDIGMMINLLKNKNE